MRETETARESARHQRRSGERGKEEGKKHDEGSPVLVGLKYPQAVWLTV